MTEINLPKIRIKYNRFLDPIFKAYIKSNPKWKDWVEPTETEVKERVKKYKEEWTKYEKKILEGICEVLNLNFSQNIIDVHIVSGNDRQFSNPIVIKSGFELDEFIESITHELIHRLFSDNIQNVVAGKIFLEMFPNENELIRNHIITHSVLKFIYLDLLKDKEKLEINIEKSSKSSFPEYKRAWEIVEEMGYKELIAEFKNHYHRSKEKITTY
ncbi:MAG: hypothetical protein AAB781_01775 [Patescibacteria group bacterium]